MAPANRSRLLRHLLFLFIGGFALSWLTVFVRAAIDEGAFRTAWTHQSLPTETALPDSVTWRFIAVERFGVRSALAYRVDWAQSRVFQNRSINFDNRITGSWVPGQQSSDAPKWLDLNMITNARVNGGQATLVEHREYGFPFLSHSLLITYATDKDSHFVKNNAFRLGGTLYPTCISWLALIQNTVFYSAALLLCLFMPRLTRYYWRVLHLQCTACGYSLRGISSDRCPECGSASNPDNRIRS